MEYVTTALTWKNSFIVPKKLIQSFISLVNSDRRDIAVYSIVPYSKTKYLVITEGRCAYKVQYLEEFLEREKEKKEEERKKKSANEIREKNYELMLIEQEKLARQHKSTKYFKTSDTFDVQECTYEEYIINQREIMNSHYGNLDWTRVNGWSGGYILTRFIGVAPDGKSPFQTKAFLNNGVYTAEYSATKEAALKTHENMHNRLSSKE